MTESLHKVLFLIDTPGWAHDYKSAQIIKHLGHKYDFRKKFHSEITEEALDEAELIVIFAAAQISVLGNLKAAFQRNRQKIIIGICSHISMEDERRRPHLEIIENYAQFVFVNNLFLYHEFSECVSKPVYYTPNGIDTSYFRRRKEYSSRAPARFALGWAGSIDNHGSFKRGFKEFIKPAAETLPDIELLTAAREDKWRTQAEMLEFYQRLDVYVSASREDGTPNPCLEAAACGLPLITTRVGNMPELIINGVNGYFIDRDIFDISNKLKILRANYALLRQMELMISRLIADWDWRKMAVPFDQMFSSFFAMQDNFPRPPSSRSLSEANCLPASPPSAVLCCAEMPVPIDVLALDADRLVGLDYLLEYEPGQLVLYSADPRKISLIKQLLDPLKNSPDRRTFLDVVKHRFAELEPEILSGQAFNSDMGFSKLQHSLRGKPTLIKTFHLSTQDIRCLAQLDQHLALQTLSPNFPENLREKEALRQWQSAFSAGQGFLTLLGQAEENVFLGATIWQRIKRTIAPYLYGKVTLINGNAEILQLPVTPDNTFSISDFFNNRFLTDTLVINFFGALYNADFVARLISHAATNSNRIIFLSNFSSPEDKDFFYQPEIFSLRANQLPGISLPPINFIITRAISLSDSQKRRAGQMFILDRQEPLDVVLQG